MCAQPSSSSNATIRGGNGAQNALGQFALCRLTLALDWTVNAMSGDVPEGSLETTWQAKLSYDRRLMNASMSAPDPPLCDLQYTRLVGLRRSLASFSPADASRSHRLGAGCAMLRLGNRGDHRIRDAAAANTRRPRDRLRQAYNKLTLVTAARLYNARPAAAPDQANAQDRAAR